MTGIVKKLTRKVWNYCASQAVSRRFNGTQSTHALKMVVAASAVRLPGVLCISTPNGILIYWRIDWQYSR